MLIFFSLFNHDHGETDLQLLSDMLSFTFHFIFSPLLAKRQTELKPTTSLFVLSEISKTCNLVLQK